MLFAECACIAPDSEQQIPKSGKFTAPIFFLCFPCWHCLLYFQTFLLLALFLLLKTSFHLSHATGTGQTRTDL